MRRLRYSVASSLDGFIAGPHGEYDWIPADPDIDFVGMFQRYDTLLMGRKTYESASASPEGLQLWAQKRVIVCSRTMANAPGAEVWSNDVVDRTAALKRESGDDIWLFGGGDLFRTLLAAGLVDDVELALVPILLGAGIPLRALTADRVTLDLAAHHVYPSSGIAMMTYRVVRKRRAGD